MTPHANDVLRNRPVKVLIEEECVTHFDECKWDASASAPYKCKRKTTGDRDAKQMNTFMEELGVGTAIGSAVAGVLGLVGWVLEKRFAGKIKKAEKYLESMGGHKAMTADELQAMRERLEDHKRTIEESMESKSFMDTIGISNKALELRRIDTLLNKLLPEQLTRENTRLERIEESETPTQSSESTARGLEGWHQLGQRNHTMNPTLRSLHDLPSEQRSVELAQRPGLDIRTRMSRAHTNNIAQEMQSREPVIRENSTSSFTVPE